MSVILTLVDLEAFDEGTAPDRRERRFCCPLPACRGKSRDASHRSLSLNTETGLWHCHRCGSSGQLREKWTPARNRRQAALHRRFGLDRRPVHREPKDWHGAIWDGRRLPGSPAAAYLARRGIPEDVAIAARVAYGNLYGAPAAIFPIKDRTGITVAVNARYLDPDASPKAKSAGDIRRGVFTTPGALDAGTIVIVEAPIDALSLATCGVPAIATCGTHAPEWLPAAIAFRSVLLGHDADAAGDKAATKLVPAFVALGAKPERFRPPLKDWNAVLLAWGTERLTAELAAVLGAPTLQSAPPTPAPLPANVTPIRRGPPVTPAAPTTTNWCRQCRAKTHHGALCLYCQLVDALKGTSLPVRHIAAAPSATPTTRKAV